MRKLLLKLIERLQSRIYGKEDDQKDFDIIRRTIEKLPIMKVSEKPWANTDVKIYVMQKSTKKTAACIGMWDGESWMIHTPLGYAPMPISLEVLGWEEKEDGHRD